LSSLIENNGNIDSNNKKFIKRVKIGILNIYYHFKIINSATNVSDQGIIYLSAALCQLKELEILELFI
jgi:hypothetical protein